MQYLLRTVHSPGVIEPIRWAKEEGRRCEGVRREGVSVKKIVSQGTYFLTHSGVSVKNVMSQGLRVHISPHTMVTH